MLTSKQKKVLKFVKKYILKKEIAPTLDEIKEYFNLASASTAHHYIKKLQGDGYLLKEYNHPRSITTIEEKRTVNLPLVGTIAAGMPIQAIEIPDETITVTKDSIGNYGDYYALRVSGNSMIEDGIFDGDIVVLKKQNYADNGQTVVAIIDDNSATLKKIYREKNQIRLQPANPELFPIYRKEVETRGVVVKIIRSLDNMIEKEKANDDKYQRKIDYSWDFAGEKIKLYTHGLHTYPAMFIPQVANRLLQKYSKTGDTVCDIFCGSGSALIESKVLDRNCIGIDLNPLAIFLAKVKTTPINPSNLTKEYYKLLNNIERNKKQEIEKPNFFNLDFWFTENVIKKLSVIKKSIKDIKDNEIRNFFMVVLSETVRLSSNSKNGEFKLVRIAKNKLENFDPDVFGIFKKKAESNIQGMNNYFVKTKNQSWTKTIKGDSSEDNGIKNSSIDFIVTSPPYGDSRTTVAYGQFSRLSAQWIDLFENPDNASNVDNELLGGKASKTLDNNLSSNYLKESLSKIADKDEKRARDVLSFFIGLNKCLKQAHKIIKPNKFFCLVVGNRLVKQVRIPTDFIIAELGEKIGFSCEEIIVRNIPGKRMPSKTSPTNVTGILGDTMTKESIVVLKKIK